MRLVHRRSTEVEPMPFPLVPSPIVLTMREARPNSARPCLRPFAPARPASTLLAGWPRQARRREAERTSNGLCASYLLGASLERYTSSGSDRRRMRAYFSQGPSSHLRDSHCTLRRDMCAPFCASPCLRVFACVMVGLRFLRLYAATKEGEGLRLRFLLVAGRILRSFVPLPE